MSRIGDKKSSFQRSGLAFFIASGAGCLCDFPIRTTLAAPSTFRVLEPLPGWAHSVAQSISGDGRVIVGYSGRGFVVNPEERIPTRWMLDGAPESLGVIPGSTLADAPAVSRDGTTILISAYFRNQPPDERMYLWTPQDGYQASEIQPTQFRIPVALSADGEVAVGNGKPMAYPPTGEFAFRWTRKDGMSLLPGFEGATYSFAYAVSGDGSVIVGRSNSAACPNCERAFRWSEAEIVMLSSPYPEEFGWAGDLSFDGRVIVGGSSLGKGYTPVRWDEVGVPLDLGWPRQKINSSGRRYGFATAVSADGCVVAGSEHGEIGGGATFWSGATGMMDFSAYLSTTGADLGDFWIESSSGLSDDGRIVIGSGIGSRWTGESRWRAWVAVVGEVCPGDANDDGRVDDLDFVNFVAAYHWSCSPDFFFDVLGPHCRFDMDFDGAIGDADFAIFAAAYDQLLCK